MTAIHRRIEELHLLHQATGLSDRQLRHHLGLAEGEHGHLRDRRREIGKKYHMERYILNGEHIHRIVGLRSVPLDDGVVKGRLRAEVLLAAKGTCQVCGRTIKDDGIKLQVDHIIAVANGGKTVRENLQAICETCNQDKKDLKTAEDEPVVVPKGLW